MFHETVPITWPAATKGPPESPWQMPCPAMVKVQILCSKTNWALPAVWRSRQSALVKVVVVSHWRLFGAGPPVTAVPPHPETIALTPPPTWADPRATGWTLALRVINAAVRTTETLNENELLNHAIVKGTRTGLLIRNPLRVVVGMVDDLGALVRDTSGVQCDCSNNNEDGGLSASNGAMGGWEHPLVADDDSTAEVEVGGGTERRLVRELSKRGRLTSDDSSTQEDIRNGCATETLRTFCSTKIRGDITWCRNGSDQSN